LFTGLYLAHASPLKESTEKKMFLQVCFTIILIVSSFFPHT